VTVCEVVGHSHLSIFNLSVAISVLYKLRPDDMCNYVSLHVTTQHERSCWNREPHPATSCRPCSYLGDPILTFGLSPTPRDRFARRQEHTWRRMTCCVLMICILVQGTLCGKCPPTPLHPDGISRNMCLLISDFGNRTCAARLVLKY